MLDSLQASSGLINIVKEFLNVNPTQIETLNDKTKPILINRRVMKDAPLSPSMYNHSKDRIWSCISDKKICEIYDFKPHPFLKAIKAFNFADDTVLLGKSKGATFGLYRLIKNNFMMLVLNLQCLRKPT